ncbi:MAG TPA: hypothetical protein VJT75_09370 [Thermoleophilaceae bacterium]|nr:hypothetical protein [Thermoleophilaceae bacterium]
MTGFVKRLVAERIGGKRPSPFRAIAAATAAGAAAAGITYRALRN